MTVSIRQHLNELTTTHTDPTTY